MPLPLRTSLGNDANADMVAQHHVMAGDAGDGKRLLIEVEDVEAALTLHPGKRLRSIESSPHRAVEGFAVAPLPEWTRGDPRGDESWKASCLGGDQDAENDDRCKEVVDSAQRLFGEVWTDFLYDKYLMTQDSKPAEDLAESALKERYYDKLCAAFCELVLWADCEVLPSGSAGKREYGVIQFRGVDSSRRQLRRIPSEEEKWKWDQEQLATARHTTKGAARDALCAVMAALASRAEKNWLEGNDFDSVREERREKKPFETKLDAFCACLEQEWATGVRGYFSFGLLERTSIFRVAVATDGPVPRPASLVLTYHVPFEEALNFMDGKGPMRSTRRKWCHRVYALQDMMLEGDGRQVPTQHLRAEPQIRELIRSKAPVVMLDVIAALAPKDCAAEHGLSAIVKAELLALLRQAHADGKAVVFMLGGDKPRQLAQKVYLKPPFTDYGLRCGYLRWRDRTRGPWASEKSLSNGRVILGLQLPPEA